MSNSFSVLMCLYNGNTQKEIIKSINSINKNSLQPYESIIVVDGPRSADKNVLLNDITREFKYKLIWKEKNTGLIDALNIGLQHVQTEWCIRCDCDDYNHSNRFGELAVHFEKEDVAVVGSDIAEVGWPMKVHRRVPRTHDEIIDRMAWRNPFNHMSVAFRTAVVKSSGGYPNIYGREDYALWIVLAGKGWKMMNTAKVLVTAKAGPSMLGRRSGIRHIFAEIKLFQLKLQTTVLPNGISCFAFFTRCFAILAPVRVKEKIWLRLRKK